MKHYFSIAYSMAIVLGVTSTPLAQQLGPVQILTDAEGAQHFPDVEYNPQDNTYLAVWETVITDLDLSIIEGVILDGETGQNLSQPFEIIRDADNVYAPEIAYNSANNEFLVVARYQPANEVLAQRVAADGTLIGDNVILTTSQGDTFFDPAARARVVSVDYNADNNQYLVATAGPPSLKIVDPELNIVFESPTFGNGTNPSVAWASQSNVILLAYEDREARSTGAENLSAQLLNHEGELIGELIHIRDQDFAEESPRIAYNADDDQFLVVWDERIGFAEGNNTQTDTIGQLVSTDGTLIGDPIPIEQSTAYTLRQDVAYNSTDAIYLAVWKGDESGDFAFADILGRFINRDGSLAGDIFTIYDDGDDATDEGNNEQYYDESKLPVTAPNSQGGFLVVWEECGTSRDPLQCNIHARFVSMETVSFMPHWSLMN